LNNSEQGVSKVKAKQGEGEGTEVERKVRFRRDICGFREQTLQQQLGEVERSKLRRRGKELLLAKGFRVV